MTTLGMDDVIFFSIISAAAFLLILVLVLFIVICCLRRKRNRRKKASQDKEAQSASNSEEEDERKPRRDLGDVDAETSMDLQTLNVGNDLSNERNLDSKAHSPPSESREPAQVVQNGGSKNKGWKRSGRSKKKSEKDNKSVNDYSSPEDKETVLSAEPAYASVLKPAETHNSQSRDRVTSSNEGQTHASVSKKEMTHPEQSTQPGLAAYEAVKRPAGVVPLYSEVESRDRVTSSNERQTHASVSKKEMTHPEQSTQPDLAACEAVKRPAGVVPLYSEVESRDRMTSSNAGQAQASVSQQHPGQSMQFGLAAYEAVKQPAGVVPLYSEVNDGTKRPAPSANGDAKVNLSQMAVYEPVMARTLSTSEAPSSPNQALPPEYAKVDMSKKKKKSSESKPSADYEQPDLGLIKRLSSMDQPAAEYAKVNMKLKKAKSVDDQDEEMGGYANMQEMRVAMKELKDDNDDEDIPPEVPPFLGSLPTQAEIGPGVLDNNFVAKTSASEMMGSDDKDDGKKSKAKEKDKNEKNRKDSGIDKKEAKKKKEQAKRLSENLKRNDSKERRSKRDKKAKERAKSAGKEAGGGKDTALKLTTDRTDLSAKSSDENKDIQVDESSSFPGQEAFRGGFIASTSFSRSDSERKSKKKNGESSQKDKKEKKKWWKGSSRKESLDDEVFAVDNEKRRSSQTGQDDRATPAGMPDNVPAYAEVQVAGTQDKKGGNGPTGGPLVVGSVPDYEEVKVTKNQKNVSLFNYADLAQMVPGQVPAKKPSEYAAIDHDAELPYDIDYSLPTYMNTEDWVRPTMPKKI